MKPRKFLEFFATLVFSLILIACSKPDPTIILGNWRTDSFVLESLKLPLAANFEVTRSRLILKTDQGATVQEFPLSRIRAEGDKIELEFQGGLGLSLEFTVEDSNNIYFKIPFIGTKVIFKKRSA